MTYFYQECPVCARSLRVPVQYFGSIMSCSHCGGEFQAVADEQRPPGLSAHSTALSEQRLMSGPGSDFVSALESLGLSIVNSREDR
jgi:hypothetical protein